MVKITPRKKMKFKKVIKKYKNEKSKVVSIAMSKSNKKKRCKKK